MSYLNESEINCNDKLSSKFITNCWKNVDIFNLDQFLANNNSLFLFHEFWIKVITTFAFFFATSQTTNVQATFMRSILIMTYVWVSALSYRTRVWLNILIITMPWGFFENVHEMQQLIHNLSFHIALDAWTTIRFVYCIWNF